MTTSIEIQLIDSIQFNLEPVLDVSTTTRISLRYYLCAPIEGQESQSIFKTENVLFVHSAIFQKVYALI